MKKAIRNAPNQTKITLVPPLKKESSFDLFEAFEVSTYEGGTFQRFTPVSLLVEFATFEFATCSLPHNRVRYLS